MKIVSLFSGCGGLDLGMIQAGHQVVWANDIDTDAVATYNKNIGSHVILSPIEDILSSSIPESDVVIGGFPCQGFSQANLLRFENDTRNKLYLEFLRIITDKQPAYFLAENVRGILSLAGGKAIKKIEEDFSSAGYQVKKQLFNVADYGVPQNRWRVIIVGIRKDLSEKYEYSFPEPTHADSKRKKDRLLFPWITVSKALAEIPEPEENHNLPNHVYSKYKITNRNFTGHRATDPEKPSPTILARGNGKGGVCAIQHPLNHRRMSVREQAIIQTFPLKFEFIGAMSSCYRQVGNAVPVLFAKRLGEMLPKTTTL
ncbi:TPA: DNA (cytosine-5-)-methyltransferase [Legionella pneumophila subsp. pneumophila]|nr:DNA (cytosine-5-)-methyltransferase [Legionella pneumophila subsp. pneumophila]HAT9453315.1 DNA (cytosine-5-)-methyltransferase [Legionella pneumophila subsp. pneumophila]HAT9456571.1 DNA (cytosine-5-)-methyltransferase [Legionella pneumophila subsp. pneumophila]HAT9465843.1 DNA (cytosine-5-)-methyltransferase [Legionella pneumophila subsp. pneumophila]